MNQLSDFFITPVHADTLSSVTTANGSSPLPMTLMFVIFFLFFYFVMWRPQSKRAKEHRDLMNSLAKGDEVITSGGVLGRISKMTDQYVTINIHNNTEIVVQKSAIVSALPKGTLKSLE